MASELTLVPDDLEIDATIRALTEGQRVFGRYTLRHILGRGGMGVVWLGYDGRLEREVALKFLPETVYFDPSALEELKQETRRCLDLTHPNIIRIYDFLNDRQAAAISMEYLDGQTLAALRQEKKQRVFEVDEIKNWMIKVCQALHYAHHEVGVVHRDLKPANLMMNSRGQIKIADFGISQSMCESMSRLTMRRGTSGTLAYMSPQQMSGDRSKVTDDVYALGATIYEFLTGKPPFYCGDMSLQVRTTTPPKMAERRREFEISGHAIPQEWEEAIAACLAKASEDRPKDTTELAERLGFSPGALLKPAADTLSSISFANGSGGGRKIKPPPLPRRPIPTKKVLLASGVALAVAAVGWPLWHLALWPIFAPPGELQVNSSPLGATVQLSGQADHVTPASFSALRIGRYHVVITEAGYDSVEQTVTITPGVKLDLGTIPLNRAYGKLSLTTLPHHAHYSLVGAANTGNFQKEGSTPDFLSELPSGTYQLTLSDAGFPQHVETLEVPPHGINTERADLIQIAVVTGATPDTAKVFRGEMEAKQLDENERSELLELYNKAFDQYLAANLLALAAEQLAHLKDLGLEVDMKQQQLAERRSSTEREAAEQINELMSRKKFATAEEKFKMLDGVLEKDSVDRLKAPCAALLTDYQQQIDAAITSSSVGSPDAAYLQLKAFSLQHPDDLDLQLALAELQTRMAPDQDRLTAQLKVFRQFSSQNKDFITDPAFLAMQATFLKESKQLETLTEAVSAAKDGPSGIRNDLTNLESEKGTLQRRRVGNSNSNPFTQTLNFFGRAVTGHSVVSTGAYFSSQASKREAIAEVQAEIESEEKKLAQPAGSVDDAQKHYAAFLAQIPWQPE